MRIDEMLVGEDEIATIGREGRVSAPVFAPLADTARRSALVERDQVDAAVDLVVGR
jgi:hypothetical protein